MNTNAIKKYKARTAVKPVVSPTSTELKLSFALVAVVGMLAGVAIASSVDR